MLLATKFFIFQILRHGTVQGSLKKKSLILSELACRLCESLYCIREVSYSVSAAVHNLNLKSLKK